jgi:hypothetical protein
MKEPYMRATYRSLLLVALCAASTQAACEIIEAPTSARQVHGQWISVVRAGPILSGRAVTSAANGNTLIVDYAANSGCSIPYMFILVNLDHTVESPSTKQITGSFRIDQRPSITYTGTHTAGLGDKYWIIEIDQVSGTVPAFLGQLAEGSNVRFQVGDATSPAVERFSLHGAGSAIQRARSLCRGL